MRIFVLAIMAALAACTMPVDIARKYAREHGADPELVRCVGERQDMPAYCVIGGKPFYCDIEMCLPAADVRP